MKTIFTFVVLWLPLIAPICRGADQLDKWTWRNPSPTGNDLLAATYGGGQFLVVGANSAVATSPDGTFWTQRAQPNTGRGPDLYGIAYGGGLYVAVGAYGTLLTSIDGSEWIQRTSASFGSLSAVAYGGGQFVCVGDNGTILTSADGVIWRGRQSGTASWLSGIAHGNGIYVAVGQFGEIIVSSDAVSWTPQTSGTTNSLFDVSYGSGHFVAVGGALIDRQFVGTILTSANGIDWTFRDAPENARLVSVAYGNGQFAAVSWSWGESSIVTSTDGVTWAEHPSVAESLIAVCHGGSQFVAVGQEGEIVTSPDGVNWVLRTAGGDVDLYDVAYGNKTFIAAAGKSVLLSSDAETWTSVPLSLGRFSYVGHVSYANGGFIAVGKYDYGTLIFTSADGMTWKQTAISEMKWGNFSFSQAVYGNGVWVVVGYNYDDAKPILIISSDGTNWARLSPGVITPMYDLTFGDGLFVAVGDRIVTSSDGTNWTARALAITNRFSTVAYGNGRFLAAVYDYPTDASQTAFVSSADGINWISHRAANLLRPFRIRYEGGRFVLLDEHGMYTSSDGTDWVVLRYVTGPFNTSPNGGVTYGKGRYVVAGWPHYAAILTSGELAPESPSPAPGAQTFPATAVTTSSAQLNGTIDPKGSATTAYFEYGPTTSYGSKTPSGNFGTNAQSISFRVTRLVPNTTYHYRIVASNNSGTSRGNDLTFSTAVPQQLAFRGHVLDGAGKPVVQASIEARRPNSTSASVQTSPDGSYTLSLPEGEYILTASKPGFLSDMRAVALTPATAGQNFQLLPQPNPPPLVTVNTTPAFVPPEGRNGSRLVVFDGNNFVPNLASLERTNMTIVITHGWIPSVVNGPPHLEGGWVKALADSLDNNGVRSKANILAWDWKKAATAPLPPEDATPEQGIALGEALQEALGTDYRGQLHVLGHSLGTLVNGYAVDYLHGHRRALHRKASQPWLSANTHVTMFDDAAISRLIAKETLKKLLLSGTKAYASSVVLGWKNPVPKDFLWLDNYISSVGRYHPEAVNILLQKGMLLALAAVADAEWESSGALKVWKDAAVEAHSYPVSTWYPRTVAASPAIMPGFGTSFEYTAMHPTVNFPPAGLGFVPGIAYRQMDSSGDELQLEFITDADVRLFYPAVSIVGAAGAEAIAGAIADALGDGVEWGLDLGATAVRKVGSVAIDVGQAASLAAQTAVDRVADAAGTGWDLTTDLANRASYRIRMITGLGGTGSPRKLNNETDAAPAGIWLPIQIPTSATLLTFDFIMEGDGRDDALVCTLSGTNLFTLPTRFIPSGITNTSPDLDISAYAGSTNELFFGVLGGTSTNCAIRIEQVKFFGTPSVTLAITAEAGGTTLLSWPSTANGYALETSPSLGAPQWNVVTNIPSLFGGRFTVTNQWTNYTRFFRLKRQ